MYYVISIPREYVISGRSARSPSPSKYNSVVIIIVRCPGHQRSRVTDLADYKSCACAVIADIATKNRAQAARWSCDCTCVYYCC